MRNESRLTRGVSFAAVVFGLAYPFLVYTGWQKGRPRWVLGAAILLFGMRFCLTRARTPRSPWNAPAWLWIFPAVFLVGAFIFGRSALSLYWPVVISATLLFVFGRSLTHPPTLIERFALLQKPELTPAEKTYCRRVTQGWCLFFIGNGALAWGLAQGHSLKAWTLYNGFIAYLLIGGFIALEYVYRHWRFRPKGALLTEWMNRWSH